MKNLFFRSFTLILCFVSFASKVYSQGYDVTLDPVQVAGNVVPLSVNVEIKTSVNRSITFGSGLAYDFSYVSIQGEETFNFFFRPFLTASMRNYYRRKSQKKDNLRNNSGNYVALLSGYNFKTSVSVGNDVVETNLDNFFIGPVWGIQRNYASGIHLDLNIGLGYVKAQSNQNIAIQEGITLIGEFEIGYKIL
ncbi:MAG: hypothetical protein AAGA66_06755 [Bacteroidota bacterium]